MHVRTAGKHDAEAISNLLEAAFGRPDEARLFRVLPGDEDLATALVAENGDGGLAGVAVLSHLRTPQGCLALGPLAVARELHGQGVGKELIGAGIDWARRAGHAGIFVLGRPEYYARFGFSVGAAAPFESPYPADFMMALELRPGALGEALAEGGELRYPPAFAALD